MEASTNFTALYNNTLNASRSAASPVIAAYSVKAIAWCIAYGVIAVITIFGNSITIAAFTRKNFQRKRLHYILINLAVTDLTIGAISVPLQMVSFFFLVPPSVDSMHYFVDILSGVASMYSIAFVALERLIAVCWPLHHRLLKIWHYTLTISLTWIIGGITALVSSSILTRHYRLISPLLALHVRTVVTTIPIVVTIITYCMLWTIRHFRKTTAHRVGQHNKSIACTLLIVTVIFFFTWSPFLILSTTLVYLRYHNQCCSLASLNSLFLAAHVTKLLQYSNSCINPFIYTLRISSFRTAVWEILRCPRTSNNQVNGSREMIISTSAATGEMETHRTVSGNHRSRESEKMKTPTELGIDSVLPYLANEEEFKKCLEQGNVRLVSFKRLNSLDRRHAYSSKVNIS